MPKNGFLERQKIERQVYFDAGLQMGRQQILDMVSIVLNDPDIMGKDTFGKERLIKVVKGVGEYIDVFQKAWERDDETDYYRSKLDDRLLQKEICTRVKAIWQASLGRLFCDCPSITKAERKSTTDGILERAYPFPALSIPLVDTLQNINAVWMMRITLLPLRSMFWVRCLWKTQSRKCKTCLCDVAKIHLTTFTKRKMKNEQT